jgi:hypothetical protein
MRWLPYSLAFAILCTVGTAQADGVSPAVATPLQREQAQSRFKRGKELMNKGRFEEASGEFRASHDIVASPNTRLELGRCMRSWGRPVAAYAELGRAAVEAKELMAEDNRYRRAYDSALAERAELEPTLGFVQLSIDNPSDGTKVTVNGEELRRAAWTEDAPVVAGTANVVVETPGHKPVTKSVTLAAGEKTSLAIDAQSGELEGGPAPAPVVAPVEPNRAPFRKWAYVSAGTGAAGLITFAVFGALAQSKYNDLQSACGNRPCPPSQSGNVSTGRTFEAVANVGLVVGLAGAAGAVVLWTLPWQKASTPPTAAVFFGPTGIGASGVF